MIGTKKNTKKDGPRERVLQAAESLFNEFGYTAVTVHHIAKKLGIKAASLYYHAPGGKEELFVMVLERSLARHKQGIENAINDSGNDLRAQCRGIINWFLSQGPLGYLRLLMSDFVGLEPETAKRLRSLTDKSLLQPICGVFEEARERGEIEVSQPQLMAGSLLSMVDGIWYAATMQQSESTKEDMASEYVDVLLNGMRPR